MGDPNEGMVLKFQPKGGMCRVCAHVHDDCHELPFFEMQVIGKLEEENEPTTLIVRCDEFNRLN